MSKTYMKLRTVAMGFGLAAMGLLSACTKASGDDVQPQRKDTTPYTFRQTGCNETKYYNRVITDNKNHTITVGATTDSQNPVISVMGQDFPRTVCPPPAP